MGGRIDGDDNDAGVLGPLNRRLYARLVDGRDDDQVDALLDERVDLRVLIGEIELRILGVDLGADLGRCLLGALVHGRKERIGHVLNHQADLRDLFRCLGGDVGNRPPSHQDHR